MNLIKCFYNLSLHKIEFKIIQIGLLILKKEKKNIYIYTYIYRNAQLVQNRLVKGNAFVIIFVFNT